MSGPDMSGAAKEARNKAEKVGNDDRFEAVARIRFVMSGVMHILIGYLAVQVALGSSEGSADQSGALGQLADAPGGSIILWVGVVGFFMLALWHFIEGATMRGEDVMSDRIKALAKGGVYAALGATTLQFAMGSGSSSSETSKGFTAKMMENPVGVIAIGIIGVVVIGVGVYHVYKGWAEKFLEDLRSGQMASETTSEVSKGVRLMGKIGYIAKGIALALVGGLFVMAAVTNDSEDASGMDGALKTVRDQPFGPYLLIAVAIGLAAYGVYAIARSRYGRM